MSERRGLFDDPQYAPRDQQAFTATPPVRPGDGRPAPAAAVPTCPGCSSREVRKASVVWEMGTVRTTTQGTAVGVVGGELAVGGVSSESVNRSMLAERAGPPAKPTMSETWAAVIGGGVAVLGGLFFEWWLLVPLIVVGAIGLVAWTVWRYYGRLPSWQAALTQWQERCWVCAVCGKIFMASR